MRLPLALALVAGLSSPAHALDSDGIEPDPVLTPGAVRTTVRDEIVGVNTATVRKVTGAEKLAVYRRYGMTGPSGTFPGTSVQGPWEVDHLVSLELGGSNDITNLWPESYSQAMGAHQKDALENRLHHMVCADLLTVEEAQHDIATDWVAAYRKYVGALQ